MGQPMRLCVRVSDVLLCDDDCSGDDVLFDNDGTCFHGECRGSAYLKNRQRMNHRYKRFFGSLGFELCIRQKDAEDRPCLLLIIFAEKSFFYGVFVLCLHYSHSLSFCEYLISDGCNSLLPAPSRWVHLGLWYCVCVATATFVFQMYVFVLMHVWPR